MISTLIPAPLDIPVSSEKVQLFDLLTGEGVLRAILTFTVYSFAAFLFGKTLTKIIQKSKLEKTLSKFLISAVKFMVIAVILLTVAGLMGVPISSIVALFSIVGLALSLSIQGFLSNLFSGLTILASKPFVVGDFVEMCTITGTIREVSLINTVLTTADNRIIYIPNSSITSSNITNYTKEPLRRIDFVFTVSYRCSPGDVKDVISKLMDDENRILQDPKPFISIQTFGDKYVEYIARMWVKNSDYWDVYHKFAEDIWESFSKNRIDMGRNKVNIQITKTPDEEN